MKLTTIQQEVLTLLCEGKIILIDRMKMASIGSKNIDPNTLYFLTDNKLITRKDKIISIYSKGNGYIISAKGQKILNTNKNIIRRGSPRILLKEKKCPKCETIKPISSFVSKYGFKNPRGKYCENCFLTIQQEQVISLMEGRDFCLYCGEKIARVYYRTMNENLSRSYVHKDHMDPLSLGGEYSDNNTVYCCIKCNIKKGNKSFIDWLKNLEPKYCTLAREVYIKKHKYTPESFKPYQTE